MPYTVPTAAEFKARLPAFASVDDAVVTVALTEASSRVDTTWLETDYQPAILYLAAHNLTLDGHGTGTEAQLGAQGLLGFQSISSGQLSVSRGSGAGQTNAGDYRSTSYGSRFHQIMKRNSVNILAL